MDKERIRILITGFPVDGRLEDDGSALFSKELPKLNTFDVHYMSAPLNLFSPEAINFGKKIIEQAQAIKAEAIISLSMSATAKGLRIESRAFNYNQGEAYSDFDENTKLDNNHPEIKTLSIDLSLWDLQKIFQGLNQLEVRHENTVATDHSSFWSNAIMFRTLAAMQTADYKIPYLFVHLPCTPEAVKNMPLLRKKNAVTMSKREILRALLVIMSYFKQSAE